jgi:hypothetical protein
LTGEHAQGQSMMLRSMACWQIGNRAVFRSCWAPGLAKSSGLTIVRVGSAGKPRRMATPATGTFDRSLIQLPTLGSRNCIGPPGLPMHRVSLTGACQPRQWLYQPSGLGSLPLQARRASRRWTGAAQTQHPAGPRNGARISRVVGCDKRSAGTPPGSAGTPLPGHHYPTQHEKRQP